MEGISSRKLPDTCFLLSCGSHLEHSPCRSCWTYSSVQSPRGACCCVWLVFYGVCLCFADMGSRFSSRVFRLLHSGSIHFLLSASGDGALVSRCPMNLTPSPNHALQPTATAVTACAADRRHLSAHRHRPRQPPPWLSLGSLGVATRVLSN